MSAALRSSSKQEVDDEKVHSFHRHVWCVLDFDVRLEGTSRGNEFVGGEFKSRCSVCRFVAASFCIYVSGSRSGSSCFSISSTNLDSRAHFRLVANDYESLDRKSHRAPDNKRESVRKQHGVFRRKAGST